MSIPGKAQITEIVDTPVVAMGLTGRREDKSGGAEVKMPY
jgi:hypothetical protein